MKKPNFFMKVDNSAETTGTATIRNTTRIKNAKAAQRRRPSLIRLPWNCPVTVV